MQVQDKTATHQHVNSSAAHTASTKALQKKAVGVVQKAEPEEEVQQHQSAGTVQKMDAPEPDEEHPAGVIQHKSQQTEVNAFPVQRQENKTGMPDNLKSGIENLSGMSMDHVKVHYNSSQPAQLNALAYAQGSDIHVGPGQEKHLPHEAWHVVQQAQGRVQATTQMKTGVAVNDDPGLEHEADVMGAKAMTQSQQSIKPNALTEGTKNATSAQAKQFLKVVQMVTPLRTDVLNVVGEDHSETKLRNAKEKRYTAAHAGSDKYWSENEFRERAYSFFKDYVNDKRAFADPFELRFNHAQKFLAENSVIVESDGNANRTNAVALDNLNSQQKFISNLWVYLGNLNSSLLEFQTDGFEVPDIRRTQMLGYRQQVKNIAVTWQAARVDLAGARHEAPPPAVFDWTAGGIPVATRPNARSNFKHSVDALELANVVALTTDQLSQDRSNAMHLAAQNRSGELGVWKVGDVHRAHMLAQDPKNYNLVSRAAFNSDYLTWPG